MKRWCWGITAALLISAAVACLLLLVLQPPPWPKPFPPPPSDAQLKQAEQDARRRNQMSVTLEYEFQSAPFDFPIPLGRLAGSGVRWGSPATQPATSAILFTAVFEPTHPGGVVNATDRLNGKPLWSTRLFVNGRDAQQITSNAISLQVASGCVFVTAMENEARYLEVLDAQTGQMLYQRNFPTAAQAEALLGRKAAWQEKIKAMAYSFHAENTNMITSLAQLEPPTTLRIEVGRMDLRQVIHFTFGSRGKDTFTLLGNEHSSFASRSGVLYVGQPRMGDQGCLVQAYDLATGALRWGRMVDGIGPVSHFDYASAVSLELSNPADQGRDPVIIVTGHESAADYIQVLDQETGVVLANRVFNETEWYKRQQSQFGR